MNEEKTQMKSALVASAIKINEILRGSLWWFESDDFVEFNCNAGDKWCKKERFAAFGDLNRFSPLICLKNKFFFSKYALLFELFQIDTDWEQRQNKNIIRKKELSSAHEIFNLAHATRTRHQVSSPNRKSNKFFCCFEGKTPKIYEPCKRDRNTARARENRNKTNNFSWFRRHIRYRPTNFPNE